MSTAQFKAVLINTFHDYNASCNNEALHMLSGNYIPTELQTLVQSPATADALVKEAVANMRRCVVLISSDDSTARSTYNSWNARMLHHWFPWIGVVGRLNSNPHPNIPAHLISVIHELNWPEIQVYTAALEQFK